MSPLRLHFLGSPQFTQDDRPVELNTAKAIALLAYLAVAGQPQTRERLADLLWPESLPDAARKNLRNTLWRIRKALEDAVLRADGDRIALSAAVWVDAPAFEAAARTLSAGEMLAPEPLQEAIDLYRGSLLDGLTLNEAPDFEIWLAGERERFGQMYLRMLEALVAAHRAEGNWPQVIAVAQRALAYDNLQEPMYRALMEAHARLGERHEALRQYEVLRATLQRKLGVQPLPETEALRKAVRNDQLRLTETPMPAMIRRLPSTHRESPRPSTPFVGRQAEWATLDQALQTAAQVQAQIVLLTGELGIGKSRLWQEWSAALSKDRVILETRCLDTTQSLPFAPLTALFRQRPCTEHILRPPSPVAPVWLAELARLLPEVRQHWPALPASMDLPADEERHRLFEAFTQVLRAMGAQPLILFVDDLHWADRATLDWLVYLVDRMRDEPLLLVGAYRPADAPAQLVRQVAGWRRQGLSQPLPLPRLTLEEATELIAALGGDAAQAGQLHARSAGNPYFLIELTRAGPEETPTQLAELMRTRLSRLSDAARQVLQAAAILNAGFDFAVLRRTSGRGEEETLDALDALLEAAVLVERNGHYEFAHPLVAAIVREELSIARRSFLNRRAAEALETVYAGRLEQIAGRLASHYGQAGHPTRAARYAELAAESALSLAAPDEAMAFYRQALTLEPTPGRRMGLGRALFMRGDLERAREALCQALAEFEAQGERAGMVRATLALAESYLPSGQGEMTVQWAERALGILDEHLSPELRAGVLHLLGAGGLQSGQPLAEAEAHLAEAARLATENDLPEMATRSRFELGNLLAQRGDLEGALAAFAETIALARAAGDRMQEILGHNNLAYHAVLAGDPSTGSGQAPSTELRAGLATAREHIEAGLALAEAHSLFLPRQYLYSTRGEVALAEKELDEAEAWFTRALTEAEARANRLQAANIRANLGLVARARGTLDEALIALETAREAIADLTAPHLQTQIDLWLAELHLQRGERAAAEEALSRAEARLANGEREGLATWVAQVRASTSAP